MHDHVADAAIRALDWFGGGATDTLATVCVVLDEIAKRVDMVVAAAHSGLLDGVWLESWVSLPCRTGPATTQHLVTSQLTAGDLSAADSVTAVTAHGLRALLRDARTILRADHDTLTVGLCVVGELVALSGFRGFGFRGSRHGWLLYLTAG
jgi:hypothetical protein